MPVFRFENYPDSPYTAEILRMMSAGPQAQARAAQESADYRAQALLTRGQGAAQVGNTLANTVGQIASIPAAVHQERAQQQAARLDFATKATNLTKTRFELSEEARKAAEANAQTRLETVGQVFKSAKSVEDLPDLVKTLNGMGILSDQDAGSILNTPHTAEEFASTQQKAIALMPSTIAAQRALEAKGPTNAPAGSMARDASGQVIPGSEVPVEPPQVNPETVRHNQALEEIAKSTGDRAALTLAEQTRHNRAMEARPVAGTGLPPEEPQTPDPASQNILSQTGLNINAFRYLTGQASQLPRDAKTRALAARDAETWARAHNVDISTMASQYKSYNDVLSANISRLNNTKIMEQELVGTIQNLQGVVKDQDLGKLKVANVLKVWAGQEVNDSLAQQYAMHLSQLRNELTAYYGATQGRTGNNLTIEDKREAENVIKNGIASGSLNGLAKAIENSTGKMGTVMQGSVNRVQKSIWGLFGVGENYQDKGGQGKAGDVKVPDPLGIR
jgi:hypothetical protein